MGQVSGYGDMIEEGIEKKRSRISDKAVLMMIVWK